MKQNANHLAVDFSTHERKNPTMQERIRKAERKYKGRMFGEYQNVNHFNGSYPDAYQTASSAGMVQR